MENGIQESPVRGVGEGKVMQLGESGVVERARWTGSAAY